MAGATRVPATLTIAGDLTVTRIAPKPSRFTVRSPAMVSVAGTRVAPAIVRLRFPEYPPTRRLLPPA
ncbi:MAG: hypothetical protein ACHQF3_12945, partial [Alphaproteobacteria bacterium]